MSKKQKTKNVTHVEDTEVNVTQVVEQPKETTVMEIPKSKEDSWEIKDRIYRLKNGKSPLSRMIKASDIYYCSTFSVSFLFVSIDIVNLSDLQICGPHCHTFESKLL